MLINTQDDPIMGAVVVDQAEVEVEINTLLALIFFLIGLIFNHTFALLLRVMEFLGNLLSPRLNNVKFASTLIILLWSVGIVSIILMLLIYYQSHFPL